MGSLFKPSTTVVQAPQQQTVTQQIPDYFKEIQERTLRRAEELGTRPYEAFTGQRIAPLSTLEQQAQAIPAQIGNIGAQTFDTAAAQQYMNPFTNVVIQSTLADLGEQFGQQERALAARAVGAGAFGGTRFGVESALGRERFLDQVADTSARLRQAGFESGAQRFAADRATQLSAQQAQLQGMASLGGFERGIQQAGLAEAYRDFIEEREYPVEQVRQVVGALAGAPIRTYGEERSGFVGTPVAGPSPFGQVAGAVGAVAPFFSDIRLKDDIQLVGKSPSGINIYNFKYKGDNKQYQGVMAHQVPQASEVHANGYLYVDYSKIDVDFKEI